MVAREESQHIDATSEVPLERVSIGAGFRTELQRELFGRSLPTSPVYSILKQGGTAAALRIELPGEGPADILVRGITQKDLEEAVLIATGIRSDEARETLFINESRLLQVLVHAEEHGAEIVSPLGDNPHSIWSEVLERSVGALNSEQIKRSFHLTEILPKVFHLHCDSHDLGAATLLRFQEHYESPRFRDEEFSLEEFKAWYPSNDYASGFSYYRDWGGFNFPDYVVSRFLEGEFDPLSPNEKAFLELLKDLEPPYYIIGSGGGAKSEVRQHELAHALYYLDSDYRTGIKAILGDHPMKKVRAGLIKSGYCEEVLEDETQAYLIDGPETLRSEFGIPEGNYAKQIKALRELFARHFERLALQ